MAAAAVQRPLEVHAKYSPVVWDKIPPHTEAFTYIRQHPLENHFSDDIRSVFHGHNMEKTFSLVLLHRHFPLATNERLVDYNDVASPWDMNSPAASSITDRIFPKTWAFIDGILYPYEFGFQGDPNTKAQHCELPEAFVKDLHAILVKNGVENVFGLGWTSTQGTTRASEKNSTDEMRMEFTVGRTSVTTVQAKDCDIADSVEAGWVYPRMDPFSAGKPGKVYRRCHQCS